MNYKMPFRIFTGTALGCLLAACTIKPGYAEVHLPAIESDNMVLQAGDHSHLFGDAAPGEVVTITYGDKKAKAAADSNGHWQADLKKLKAGEKFDIVVKGNNTVTIKNVLVGEVWLCSGQSNMEFPLDRANDGKKETAEANHDQIRLFMVKRTVAATPVSDVQGSWKVCDPASAAPFSAVAYFFGRALSEDLKTPVGLIESSWGGTPAQAWTSLDGLAADPVTNSRYGAVAKMQLAELGEAVQKYEKVLAEWKASQEKLGDKEKTPPPQKPPGVQFPYAPSMLYNGMIAPLKNCTIGGVIWYQGESNTHKSDDALTYRRLFPALILDWRKKFNLPELPFLFVQLANYDKQEGPNEASTWAELRESQLLTLGLPHTGMAVAIDIGDQKDIHPKDKQDVGKRLERIALAKVYGKKEDFSGPIFSRLDIKGDTAICHFKYAEKGLKAGEDGHATGFIICGADKKFVPAEAVVSGDTVLVTSPKVSEPVAVRYAWQGSPTVNLYNQVGLPASPFRSDVPSQPSVDFTQANAQ
jgi:sialate O-acetylesterase